MALTNCPYTINIIPIQLENMVELALAKYPQALQYVRDLDSVNIGNVLDADGSTIQFLPDRLKTYDNCLRAVKSYG